MRTNVEIKSKKVQKYIEEHKSTFSKEDFIDLSESYINALRNGTLLFVKKEERSNSSVYRVGSMNDNRFNEFTSLFAALGYKTNELEIVIPLTGGRLTNDTNKYVCEKLFDEGLLSKEEFERLKAVDVAAI